MLKRFMQWLKKPENVFLISGIVIFLWVYSVILFTSPEIEISFLPIITINDLELFVKVFKYPIYFVVGFVPAYGIFLAYRRMRQTEQQNAIINFQNTFFHLLNTLTNYIGSLSHGQLRGRQILEDFYKKISGNKDTLASRKASFESNFYNEQGHFIKTYMDIIDIILIHIIEGAENKDRVFYCNILVSTLTEYERKIISSYFFYKIAPEFNNRFIELNLFPEFE